MLIGTKKTLSFLVDEIQATSGIVDDFYWTDWTTTPIYLEVMFKEFVERFPKEIPERESDSVPLKDRMDYSLWMEIIGKYLYEAISNANRHGNKDIPTKKIGIDRYYGRNGVTYSISDEGQGFDVGTTVEDAIKKNAIPQHGFTLFHQADMVVAFNITGNEIYFQYLSKLPQKPL